MLNVGVNLLWLVPGVVGGSEEYTLRALRALDECRPPGVQLRIYGQHQLFEFHRDLADRFEAVVSPPMPSSRLARVGVEATWLATASAQDSVVHYAGGVMPARRRVQSVLTIHDIQPLDLPHNFSPAKRRWLSFMLPRSVRAADLIITISQFSATRLVEVLDADPNRIVVIPHGHPEVAPGVTDPDIDRRLRQRYGRYLLYPAISYKHKRHRDLIDALTILRRTYDDVSVVLTGRDGPLTPDLKAQAEAAGLSDHVHFTGRISELALDALYRSATATVIPSEYEGFGIPALEAMARGCPVVAANSTAVPEVVGEAGLLVPPRNPQAIADAVDLVLTEGFRREMMTEAGRSQAQRFSWAATGQALLEAYGASTQTSQPKRDSN